MYTQPQKKFRAKKIDDIEAEILSVVASGQKHQRVFLADGDAMTLPFKRLKEILLLIRKHMPDVQRVSAYCLPRNIKSKSLAELYELGNLGLGIVYVGCESGDDEVLALVEKGETYDSQLDALYKLKGAGIKTSVMILNGLGGTEFSKQHALNSARLMNEAQPDYLSTLVVSFPLGQAKFAHNFKNGFQLPDQHGLFLEMQMLLENLELNNTVFRSDHASNYLSLKGTLGKDKAQLLAQVRRAIEAPEHSKLRKEWQRGL
ncbi:radical SAM protein [Moritella marina ATCC 15381]|uniref:Radical SAM protein n=2 Tax=Moritella marina TaxID=90736 RepID=A0A5J6WSZ0_MORMI|nr:radical SAM protein [Moritella marina]QFI39930.1 radical SAM protein [Moritella marina ATCC 15381]